MNLLPGSKLSLPALPLLFTSSQKLLERRWNLAGNAEGPDAKPCPGLRCRAQLGGFASPAEGRGWLNPGGVWPQSTDCASVPGSFFVLWHFSWQVPALQRQYEGFGHKLLAPETEFWGGEAGGCCHHRELSLSSVFKGKFLLLLSPPDYSWLLSAPCVSPGWFCSPVGCPSCQRD